MRCTAVILVGILMRSCHSLATGDFEECRANTVCSQNRGKIDFNWWRLPGFERQHSNSRSWTIKPSGTSNIMIAFKNFNVIGDIYIGVPSGRAILWRKLTWDLGRNFEYTYQDVTSLTIYVSGDERGSFDAFFYVGCEVVTTSIGEVSFPRDDDFNFKNNRCWIIEPLEIQDLSRLYFTFRDVNLKQGSKLSVTDVHTDQQVTSITGSKKFDIFENNLRGQETFLVELTCSDGNAPCSTYGNLFSISYYSLDKREVACVEIKRLCAFAGAKLPSATCQQSCPKLDYILHEEFLKEGPVNNHQTPVVKSGAIPMRARLMRHLSKKVNETQEQKRLQKEKEEREKKEREERERIEREERERLEREERERGLPAVSWNCQLNEQDCQCMRNITEIRKYCYSATDCSVFKSCTMGCVLTRLFVCAKITSSARIELFGG